VSWQATLGLLRICTRLLPYKESSAEALLKSLQLVLRLDPHVAWDLAQQIATELLKLVKSSAAYIRSADSSDSYRVTVSGYSNMCVNSSYTRSITPSCSAASVHDVWVRLQGHAAPPDVCV